MGVHARRKSFTTEQAEAVAEMLGIDLAQEGIRARVVPPRDGRSSSNTGGATRART